MRIALHTFFLGGGWAIETFYLSEWGGWGALHRLAVNYLFMTNHGSNEHQPELVVHPFDANTELNDYEVCVIPFLPVVGAAAVVLIVLFPSFFFFSTFFTDSLGLARFDRKRRRGTLFRRRFCQPAQRFP